MQTTNNEEENRRRERIQDGIRYTGSLFDTKKQALQTAERSDAPAIIRKATENNTNPCYYLRDLTTRIDSIIKQHDQDFEQAFAEKRINLSPDPALAEYTKNLPCILTKYAPSLKSYSSKRLKITTNTQTSNYVDCN